LNYQVDYPNELMYESHFAQNKISEMNNYYDKINKLFILILKLINKDGENYKKIFIKNLKKNSDYQKSRDFHEENYSRSLKFFNSKIEGKFLSSSLNRKSQKSLRKDFNKICEFDINDRYLDVI